MQSAAPVLGLPMLSIQLWVEGIENSPTEMDFGSAGERASNVCLQLRKPVIFWAASKAVLREANRLREGIQSPCSHETPPRVLHSALGSLAREGHGEIPESGHRNNQRAEAPLL